ncbi:MAG: HAMP domain-containing sensor histidine kinase [Bacteroidales bacterium]
MLNRALSISIVAILLLLALQGVWLVRIIDNEENEFRKQTEQVLKDAINQELNSRLETFSQKDKFRISISNNPPANSKVKEEKIQAIDLKNENKDFTKFTLEEALQLAYRKILPLNIDSLSNIFLTMLTDIDKSTNFELTYKDSEYNSSFVFKYSGKRNNIPLINPSFELSIPLISSKELMIDAKIFYPNSVFKGDLLAILISSFVLTIFILLSIIMQTRMLYKQVSLAKLKENITHFLTHELRSPLQASITNLEVGEMADSKVAPYFLGKAKEQLYFLNGLIDNILDINKFEKRQASLTKVLFNINEAIEPHIARHNVESKKSVKITTDIASGQEEIYGDKLHISNAIGNLIDNAIKYSNESVNINISTRQEGKYFRISVEDNGIGIPKDEQPKIFEKFYRVNKKEHSQKGKGFGLGLNYVMWVVKSHKGKILLTSSVGVGSKFTLLLINNEHGKENSSGR